MQDEEWNDVQISVGEEAKEDSGEKLNQNRQSWAVRVSVSVNDDGDAESYHLVVSSNSLFCPDPIPF